jgi:glycosyltransferase involved in cell wall biosynthesis
LQVPEGAVHLVPEGVAHVFLDPAGPDEQQLRRAGGAPKEPYVLWVGSLRAHDPRKRLDDLVAAVASMGADAPPLVLAGRTGDESSRLAEAAARSGVRLVLTGYVADPVLAALYRGAGAVAIPSGHEGFGLTLLEAMGCGAPVVTSSGGNLAALAGDAALVVSPGDREALTDALRVALTQPDVAARLRARGVERAQTFTWRRAAEETVAVYERALGR